MPEDLLSRVRATFDREPTPAILGFEAVVILGTIVLLWLLGRERPRIVVHYLIMAIGVLVFEVFTAPMWDNFKLGEWAYIYKDVSWVLTLGWSSLILGTIFAVDRVMGARPDWQRFVGYLVVLTVLTGVLEAVVVNLGIRSYAPEVMEVAAGSYVLGGLLSLHLLYYVPVFMSLVICFYKYWAPAVDDMQFPHVRGAVWWQRLVIAFVGVFFFEVMIEPIVQNQGFPAWSYVYRDISVVQTGFWIAVIWFSMAVVDRLLPRVDFIVRFVLYLTVLSAVALPVEGWLVINGFRVYGPSAVANFSGLTTAIGGIPLEVAAAIPLYMGLIICFVRYWEAVTAGLALPALAEPKPASAAATQPAA